MKQEDIKFIRRRVQKLEQLSMKLEEDASMLKENGVNTTSSNTLLSDQEVVQDEIEQLASDLLQLLYYSDCVGESNIDLPNNRRGPVSSRNLPEPRVAKGKEAPWAGGSGKGSGRESGKGSGRESGNNNR
jgi:hypothetical protein